MSQGFAPALVLRERRTEKSRDEARLCRSACSPRCCCVLTRGTRAPQLLSAAAEERRARQAERERAKAARLIQVRRP